ncbi:CGP-CTERM sorting domain-containing protein [Thermococcus sp.]|uniref:CGP-CTERM sorting domain-containing protein n=1 Tax=Thermococcus sp. TaxID=35749 RepID=UPI002632293C|nr:CGP-CTERM sorting domain-containing protein [Thermococcus sp.]
MRRLYALALLFLFLPPLVSAGKVNLFNYLPANETVKLVTFECHSNCTPEKWFLVDNLTVIKPYNESHDLKIIITGNKSRRELIPTKNSPPFTISNINWSNLENVTKNTTAHDPYGAKWKGSFEEMNGKIWSEGINLQFHCSDCEVHGCLLILDINCSANATNCKVMSQVPPDCGMDMRYTKTNAQKPEDKRTCGPALLVGLALISALLERRINGKR